MWFESLGGICAVRLEPWLTAQHLARDVSSPDRLPGQYNSVSPGFLREMAQKAPKMCVFGLKKGAFDEPTGLFFGWHGCSRGFGKVPGAVV